MESLLRTQGLRPGLCCPAPSGLGTSFATETNYPGAKCRHRLSPAVRPGNSCHRDGVPKVRYSASVEIGNLLINLPAPLCRTFGARHHFVYLSRPHGRAYSMPVLRTWFGKKHQILSFETAAIQASPAATQSSSASRSRALKGPATFIPPLPRPRLCDSGSQDKSAAHCLLPTAYCPLPTAYCLPVPPVPSSRAQAEARLELSSMPCSMPPGQRASSRSNRPEA